MCDLVKIARTYVPFQTTHFDGCERDHRECLIQRMADEIERLTAEHTGQLAELEAISTALGTNEGHSSVDHILSLRAERDDLRRQLDEARAEREAMANVLPGHYYMDPPDGGDVPVLEQLRRMAKDAARYRWLREQPNDTTAPRIDVVRWIPADESVNDGEGLRLDELDAAIDAAMGLTRPAEEA